MPPPHLARHMACGRLWWAHKCKTMSLWSHFCLLLPNGSGEGGRPFQMTPDQHPLFRQPSSFTGAWSCAHMRRQQRNRKCPWTGPCLRREARGQPGCALKLKDTAKETFSNPQPAKACLKSRFWKGRQPCSQHVVFLLLFLEKHQSRPCSQGSPIGDGLLRGCDIPCHYHP